LPSGNSSALFILLPLAAAAAESGRKDLKKEIAEALENF
jgi:hypothetical protein